MQPHERFDWVYALCGQDFALVTKNSTPGESVYKEKRVSEEDKSTETKTDYRVWNLFRSKIAAIVGGI